MQPNKDYPLNISRPFRKFKQMLKPERSSAIFLGVSNCFTSIDFNPYQDRMLFKMLRLQSQSPVQPSNCCHISLYDIHWPFLINNEIGHSLANQTYRTKLQNISKKLFNRWDISRDSALQIIILRQLFQTPKGDLTFFINFNN